MAQASPLGRTSDPSGPTKLKNQQKLRERKCRKLGRLSGKLQKVLPDTSLSGVIRAPLVRFTPTGIADAAHSFDIKQVLSCLDKAGTIAERDNDRYGRLTKCIRIKGGGIARGYVINPAALLAATEE